MGLPLSSVSSSANSSTFSARRSPIFQMMRPRWLALIFAQGPDSNARLAAFTARSMSALSPSATRARTSPVAGSIESNVLPDEAAIHLPSIKSFLGVAKNSVTVLWTCNGVAVAINGLLRLEVLEGTGQFTTEKQAIGDWQ